MKEDEIRTELAAVKKELAEQRKLLEITLGEVMVICASVFASAAKPKNGSQLAAIMEKHHEMIQQSVLHKLSQHGVPVSQQSALREILGKPENN